jgi:hypothetical protein
VNDVFINNKKVCEVLSKCELGHFLKVELGLLLSTIKHIISFLGRLFVESYLLWLGMFTIEVGQANYHCIYLYNRPSGTKVSAASIYIIGHPAGKLAQPVFI